MLLNYNKSSGWGGVIGDTIKGIKKSSSESPLVKSNTEDYLNSVQALSDQGLLNSDSIKDLRANFSEINEDAVKLSENLANGTAQLNEGETALSRFRSQSSALTNVWAGLKNIGAQFVSTVVNGLVSMAASAAISLAVEGVTKLITSYDDLSKKMGELSSAYQTKQSELQGYSKEITNLRGVMEDETSTTDEVKAATSRLYEVQNQLIGTYGAYASGIDLVNGKLEDQLGIIKNIEQMNLQEWENETKSQRSAQSSALNLWLNLTEDTATLGGTAAARFTKGFTDFMNGADVSDVVKNFFFGEEIFTGYDLGRKVKGTGLDEIINKYENFERVINATDNRKVNDLIDSFDEFTVIDGKIQVKGAVDDVAEAVQRLQVNLKNLGYEDERLDKELTETFQDANKIVKQDAESYKTYTYSKIMADEELAGVYFKLESAYESYNEAVKSGDKEQVKSAESTYLDIIKGIETNTKVSDKNKEYFRNLHNELQGVISDWQFEAEVIPKYDETEFEDYLKNNSIEKVISDYYKYKAGGATPYAKYFDEIETDAANTKKSVDELLTSLSKLNYSSTKNALLAKGTTTTATGEEEAKIDEWGLSRYKDQITSGTIQSKYGNVDMDNRKVIEWDEWNLARFKGALKSWEQEFDNRGNLIHSYYDDLVEAYEKGEKSIDTVYGGSDKFDFGNGKQHEIAFTPIFTTEDGDTIFMDAEDVRKYIETVISKATEDGDYSFEEILEIDAEGTGFKVGNDYVKGIIAGIGSYTGEGGATIGAETVGSLLHFSGSFGAYSLAKQTDSTDANLGMQGTINSLLSKPVQAEEQLTEQQQRHNEVLNEWYANLQKTNAEAAAFFDSLDPEDENVKIATEFVTPVEFDMWLYNLQHQADENPVEVTITYESDQTKALDDLDSAFDDDLDTAYTASQSGQTVSASELQAVNDAFGGTTFNAEDNINSLSTAIESYNQTLSKTDVTAAQAQTATDQLVTAYIDQSNVLDDLLNSLDDLDEAQVQYVKDQLTAQGVTNAGEVVESRLTKAYQKANTALKNVATTLTKYNKILKAGDTSADEYDTAMKSMIDNTREMIGVYDEAGNFSDELTPELNADFILTNLELIERATAGDVTAIQELRAEAAKQIQIDIDLNDKAVYQAHNDLIDLVAGLDASSFSIDGFMDNSAAYSAMAALISQAGYTAAQVKSIISAASGGTITADVGYDYVTTDVPSVYVPNEANDNAKQTGVITYKATKVKVPKFTFKYNEKASSSGAGATYGGGGGGSSSGSGGGGGGDSGSSDNKKTEDDEETYDWIEVYIQRLEEELDRLDEIVDSTYTSWSKRNNTLKKELKNLNSQIEANNTAYDNYISKANSIQVNDGKTKVDDDDYGDNDSKQKTYDQGQLDTAISEWATGKYQKLIQEGKLGTDAIEKIQNTYLKNTIEAYKEWYEKAVDAKDKATTLAETIKSKYEQLFNNIKSQYDELINKISKKTDLVEERISRMEEMGYFVDKNYYTKQRKLTEEELKKQNKMTDALIAKRKEAIEKGKITVGSEADMSMQQEIYNSQIAASQLLTELVKIKNTIRQQDWDRFDWLEEQLEQINSEAEHFANILDHFKQVDEKGNFTNEGLATLATYTAQYEQNKKELEDYQAEYQKVQADLLKDPNNKNLIARADELRQKILELEEKNWEVAENSKSAWQEAFDAHLSNLQTIINNYKEALSSAKDLYTYQNNVEKQAKSIARLEKQIAAYGGDNSEEARKKRIELQQQYEDQQQQLQETEWDRYISETGELLDDMYENYEDYLNDKLDDITTIMDDTNILLKANQQEVKDGFDKVTTTWDAKNLNLPDAFTSDDKNDIVNKIGEVIDTLKEVRQHVTNVDDNGNGSTAEVNKGDKDITGDNTSEMQKQQVANTKEEEKEREKQAKLKAEEKKAEAAKQKATEKAKNKTWVNGVYWENGKQKYTGGDWKKDAKGSYYVYGNGQYLKNAWHTIDGVKYHFDKNGYVDKVQGSMLDNSANVKVKQLKNQKVTGTLTQLATGIKRVTRPDIYETNEADTGSELIYKTRSGGILTPLDAGDMVFSHEMSQRLWDIASSNVPVGGNIQMVNIPSSLTSGTVNVNAEATFNLPNVTNYDEFKHGLENDTNFEKFIQEITVGRLNGNNTMNKRKYK